MNFQQTQYFENRNRFFQSNYSPVRLIGMGISPTFTVADTLNKAIAEFEAVRNVTLRADARFLLQLNFQEVIYNPLNNNTNHVTLLQSIYRDTKVILEEAGIIGLNSNDREISGHVVLQAVAAKWEVLETLGKGSW